MDTKIQGIRTNRSGRGARHVRRAFSLLEIMLVVVIIGLLMSVAAWNMIGAGNKTRVMATKGKMKQIEMTVNQYSLEKGSFPATLVVLTTGTTAMIKPDVLADAWKRPFTYYVPGPSGKPFGLLSAGIDGEVGTADDIDVWNMDQEQ